MIEKDPSVEALIRQALKEDIGRKDITSAALIPADQVVKADVIFKEEGVLCGIAIAESVFRLADPDIRFLPAAKDGEEIEAGRVVFYLEGPCRAVLAAERTALNFLARMSGVATLTRKYANAVKGTRAAILDTRKTPPLLRHFDKYAVRTGGGRNHRFGLYDGVLIKDNHLRALAGRPFGDLCRQVRAAVPRHVPAGIEVRTLDETRQALGAGFDYILLDNFAVDEVRQAAALRAKAVADEEFEVSGGVRLDNVRAYADCGVERIAVGEITHSPRATDVSLNLL